MQLICTIRTDIIPWYHLNSPTTLKMPLGLSDTSAIPIGSQAYPLRYNVRKTLQPTGLILGFRCTALGMYPHCSAFRASHQTAALC